MPIIGQKHKNILSLIFHLSEAKAKETKRNGDQIRISSSRNYY